MTPIEIMALIIALLAAVKILVILIEPKNWMAVVKTVYKNPTVTTIIALIIAVITLNHLLKEITIIQIFAVMLFMASLIVIGYATYSKETIQFANKLLKDKSLLKKSWLAIIIWIVLLSWLFYALLS